MVDQRRPGRRESALSRLRCWVPAAALCAALAPGAPAVAQAPQIIDTVAGTGTPGFSGDGGLARLAQLDQPSSVFSTTTDGGFLIADTNNHRIRKVDANGVITTFAGSGPTGAANGGFGGDGGPATAARLNRPQRVRADG